jgi:hypothetical protein
VTRVSESDAFNRWVDMDVVLREGDLEPGVIGGWVVWGGFDEVVDLDTGGGSASRMDLGAGSLWRLTPEMTIEVSFPGRGWQVLHPWVMDEMERMSPKMHAAWLDARVAQRATTRPSTRRVCLCGHPIKAHIDDALCSPTRIDCHCRTLRPVIEVDDTRNFVFKTRGFREHALMSGMSRTTMSDKKWKWLPGEPRCDACGEINTHIQPVLVDVVKDAVVMDIESWGDDPPRRLVDRLLCFRCLCVHYPDAGNEIMPGWLELYKKSREEANGTSKDGDGGVA